MDELSEVSGFKVALADADFTPWPTPRLDLGDLAEIVDQAGDRMVWAHVDEPEDVEDAADFGVSVMAHPIFSEVLDDYPDVITTTTLSAFSGTGDLLDGSLLRADLARTPAGVLENWTYINKFPESLTLAWRENSTLWSEAAMGNVSQAITQKRTLLAGSDSGYWFVPHGIGLHRELEKLVEAGMTPLQAVVAATDVPAQVLGWSDVGRLDAGYRADLLVVYADPMEDIRNTQKIEAVWQGGVAIERKADALQRPSKTKEEGTFCLNDADCRGSLRCDLVDHLCQPACDPPFDADADCGPTRWCMPADGIAAREGVCHLSPGCDLIAQDCSPSAYAEACVPMDEDTNRCVLSGPRRPGQTCDTLVAELACEIGSFCSIIDGRCYQLCDPADPPTGCSCIQANTPDGDRWFSYCFTP